MRPFVVIAGLFALVLVGGAAIAFLGYRQSFPKASSEVVDFTPERRAAIARLRAEQKFRPHDFPPLGYTGSATPRDSDVATAAVDEMLDAVLRQPDGPLQAKTVSRLIARAMDHVNLLETEDRDRAGDYMLEAWYLLGFKGATGRFAYGPAFPRPPGYEEPLPPGWKSPTEPRPIP
jgi:hypothetical protein